MGEARQSVKKNYIYNTLFQIISIIIPFITTPYVSRTIGAENIGKFSYATAIANIFMIVAALGTSTYGQRKIAFCRDNIYELSSSFWNIVCFRFIFSNIAFAAYFLYIYHFEGITIINTITSFYILNVWLDIIWFYQGVENFKGIVIRNAIIRALSLIGIFVLVHDNSDTWKYVLIIVLSQIIGSISMWIRIPNLVKKPNKLKPFDGFKEIILVFLPTIAIQVYTILDKSMIGWITHSDYLNGCYDQSEKIARLIITIITSIGVVVLPRVANLYSRNELNAAKNYIYKAFRVVWLTGIPMTLGLFMISNLFIPIYLGNGFEDAIILLKIFSFLLLPVSSAYVVGLSYLIPTKQQNVYTVAVSIAAIVNLILNFIFIPQTGAIGAAIASVVAETLGVVLQISYCTIKKQLNFSKIFFPSLKYLIAGIIMWTFSTLLFRDVTPNLFNLILVICVSAIVYFGALIIMKDDFIINILLHIKSSIKRGII